jgi:transposase
MLLVTHRWISVRLLRLLAGFGRRFISFAWTPFFNGASLPHSDASFVKAYPAETTEAFLDGHVSAFAFFGGVPQSILYDNSRIAVTKILGGNRRIKTRAFLALQSHYLFLDKFGRPGKSLPRAPTPYALT